MASSQGVLSEGEKRDEERVGVLIDGWCGSECGGVVFKSFVFGLRFGVF